MEMGQLNYISFDSQAVAARGHRMPIETGIIQLPLSIQAICHVTDRLHGNQALASSESIHFLYCGFNK